MPRPLPRARSLRIWLALSTVVLASGGVGSWRWSVHTEARRHEIEQSARASVDRLRGEIERRAATGDVDLNGRDWPHEVDPAWFGGVLPQNRAAPGARPWLEIASGEDAALMHPRQRAARDSTTPAFWYNPALGVVRARVSPLLSDRSTLDRYNRINDSSVSTLADAPPLPEAAAPTSAPRGPKPPNRDSVVIVRPADGTD